MDIYYLNYLLEFAGCQREEDIALSHTYNRCSSRGVLHQCNLAKPIVLSQPLQSNSHAVGIDNRYFHLSFDDDIELIPQLPLDETNVALGILFKLKHPPEEAQFGPRFVLFYLGEEGNVFQSLCCTN